MTLALTEELKNNKQYDWRLWVTENRIRRHITERRTAELLSDVELIEGKTVLDIGCLFGYTSCAAAQNGAIVFGIDINESGLKVASELAAANQLKVDFIRANAKRLPFPGETFDVVTCSEVIEHVIDWEIVIKEIARVAKRNAQVVISTPNLNSMAAVKMLLVKYRLINFKGYERFLSPGRVRKELEKNDLKVRRERKINLAFSYLTFCSYRMVLWLEKITRSLEKVWGGTIIFSCRKTGSIREGLPGERNGPDKIIVCPVCLAPVREESESLVCANCSKRYPIRGGIPVMVADENEATDMAPGITAPDKREGLNYFLLDV